jgi:predicted transposase YdaD
MSLQNYGHDNPYKSFFSHKVMVEDLLKGFVVPEILQQMDLSTLEKKSGSYVSDDLREREDDIIWRVKLQDQWLYLYLLLEFQSTDDWWMPLRICTYSGLLYQDLIKSEGWVKGDLLPPVLPIVLYNGQKSWQSPLELNQLYHSVPEIFKPYQAQLKYLLIDESQYNDKMLESLGGSGGNIVGVLFQLENSASPQQFEKALAHLIQWLQEPEQESLQRLFNIWIKRVLLPRKLPGESLPDTQKLYEVQMMLSERKDNWAEQWKQEGLQEGLQKGLQKGEAAMLLRMINKKFGLVSLEARQKIEQADSETLLLWSDNLLTASTVEQIFSDL